MGFIGRDTIRVTVGGEDQFRYIVLVEVGRQDFRRLHHAAAVADIEAPQLGGGGAGAVDVAVMRTIEDFGSRVAHQVYNGGGPTGLTAGNNLFGPSAGEFGLAGSTLTL